jgi:hypothetical protein
MANSEGIITLWTLLHIYSYFLLPQTPCPHLYVCVYLAYC